MEVMMALIPVIVVLGLLLLGALAIWRRTKLHEMANRERMAMIDKGMTPPPEGSELEKILGRESAHGPADSARAPEARFRTLGVTIIGLGVALVFLIGLAGDSPRSGVGVGGAVAAVGIALVVNAYLGVRSPIGRSDRMTIDPPPQQPPAL
jgi:hypothetical protein